MFYALFLKIALSAAKLMSFVHFGAAIWHHWTIICDKCYADKPETIDALKDNIREEIGEIQLHTIDNVLKKLNRSCRLLHGQPKKPFEWNCFPLLTGRIVLSKQKKNFKKIFSSFFFKHFPKKKTIWWTLYISNKSCSNEMLVTPSIW